MKRWVGCLGVAAALVAGAFTEAPEQSPVPPDIAARLPRYCRYDLDLKDTPHPHAALLSVTHEGDVVCPFAPGQAGPVEVYGYKGKGPCDGAGFAGLKVQSIQELDGRAARRSMRCARDLTDPNAAHPPANVGRSWLLTFDENHTPRKDSTRFDGDREQDRLGGPFLAIASGEIFPEQDLKHPYAVQHIIAFKCIQIAPGVELDALGFYREAGRPLPEGVTEQEVTGRDCGEVVREKVADKGGTSGVAMPREAVYENGEFKLWLHRSRQSPTNVQMFHNIRAILVRDGARPARAGGRTGFAYGTELVSRTRDGGYIGLAGGVDFVPVDLRTLTPGVCDLLYDVAAENGLYLTTLQTDNLFVRPQRVVAKSVVDADQAIAARDGADLCALLRPGFEEWRADAPKLPADLNDIDRRQTEFFGFAIAKAVDDEAD